MDEDWNIHFQLRSGQNRWLGKDKVTGHMQHLPAVKENQLPDLQGRRVTKKTRILDAEA